MNTLSFSVKLKTPHPSTQSISKRLIDIIGSLVGLLILAVVFIPILYHAKRYGLYCKRFKILKFHTMVQNADALKILIPNEAKGLIFKNQKDPRVTRIGRFLRQTSLDEFPQFWNVLLGEMSLVGTRPPTADEVIQYNDYHWQRLNVKPGLTGEWQVNGRSAVQDFEAVVALDLRYQERWSIWYDCAIVAKTIYVVLTRIGAC